MPILKNLLSDLLLTATRAAQTAGTLPAGDIAVAVPFNTPKDRAFGDISSAVPMQLAKPLGRKPIEIAEAIVAHLPTTGLISAASVTPPGFINLTYHSTWLAAQVDDVLTLGAAYANTDLFSGQTAQVEYVSANPTGPLNVGRVRGGVIGDTMSNLLTAVGYTVTREYYFNNAGQQMTNLGESLRRRYLQQLGVEGLTLDEDGLYQGDYLIELAEKIAAEQGDALRDADWQPFKEIAEVAMFANIKTTLARLNIIHDVYFNENSLLDGGAVQAVVDELFARDLAYEQEGAVWFRATALGAEDDRVIIRSNGIPTYRLPDIAYHRNKLDRGFDLVIDVLGADHKDAFPDVIRGLQALGYTNTDNVKLLMNQFVTFKGTRMSTRKGNTLLLDDLIDELGADVVRFFLLMRAAESHLDFDLDLAREQSDSNPVYYVQYAHARVCSILRKAEGQALSASSGDVALLTHPSEQALILRILELSDIIALCVSQLAPHHLTSYARDLAATFHTFYRDCQVIDPDQPALSAARLKLVQAARIALARTLHLIGVSTPEQM